MSKDLRWTAHCQAILHKANKTLGLLRRSLSPCSKEVKTSTYQDLLRPQLEYGSEAWNPFHTTVVQRLENVQRAAARFVHQHYRRDTSATALITRLGWDPLHTRRLLAQCTMFYKVHYNFVNIPVPPFIIPAPYISRHDHQLKYAVPEAAIDAYKFSFYPRSIWVEPSTRHCSHHTYHCSVPKGCPTGHQRDAAPSRIQNIVNLEAWFLLTSTPFYCLYCI